jgi:trypsin
MKFLILLISHFLVTSGTPFTHLHSSDRIVGGNATNIEDIPYIASLHFGGIHSCGCIILTNDYVLTAAHCTSNVHPAQLLIRFGSSFHNQYGTVRSVRAIHEHPNYSPRNLDFDFSILRLQSPVLFSNSIRPILLPNLHEEFEDGLAVVTSGWGLTHNVNETRRQLRKVEVPIFNQRQCEIAYSSVNAVTERMICAGYEEGGKDACQG